MHSLIKHANNFSLKSIQYTRQPINSAELTIDHLTTEDFMISWS